jgi:type VI secretion system secreted protein Hcp
VHLTNLSSRSSTLWLGIVAVAAVGFTPAVVAQTYDTLMKVDGVPGDSVITGHVDEIVLKSYSQTFGTKNCSRVIAVKGLDRASPPLISLAVNNQIVATVVITIRKPGERPIDFFKAILTSVLIERIDLSSDTGPVTEQIVLKPRSIRIEYRGQAADGSALPPIISDTICT